MNAMSCFEIFSRLIFNAATLGIILQHNRTRSTPGINGSPNMKAGSEWVVCDCYLMPRSLARLSWRSMMLCKISSTSCLSSLSSISEMEKSGSRKDGGNAAAMDLDLKPEVTWGWGGGAELLQCDVIDLSGETLTGKVQRTFIHGSQH